MLKDLGIRQYTLSDIRGLPEGRTRHLLKIPPKQISQIPKDKLTEIRTGGLDGEASGWFDSDGCDACRAILSHNSFLISGRHVGDHTVVYTFVAPSFDAFKSIVSTLEASGLKPKMLEVAKFKSTERILTEKQETVLSLALKMGFFDFPRKTSMQELSQRLGVGLSTVSEIIRRGTRMLLESHFEA
ncbi:MAG: helix-turn-helix domain-containing protein, partial [Aigarchaeota archaeon]|nr:helix-turn-helix domain-containing protein [Aigarchaeota archaeon]